MSRKHTPRNQGNAPADLPPQQAAEAGPAAPDPSPLLFVIGINRANHVLTFTGNAASERDLELLREALQMAQANVVKELLAAAEARGAAQAATQRRVLLGDEVAAP